MGKNVDAEGVLRELEEKARNVSWHPKNRKVYYAIFARGFKSRVERENVLLFDLRELEKIWRTHLREHS